MTEPLFEPSGQSSQVQRPTGGGLAGAVGPEAVAALLSIIVVVALIGARFATVAGGGATASPTPSSAATNVPSRTAQIIDAAAIQALLTVNANLAAQGAGLEAALKTPPLDTNSVRSSFANMKGQLDSGKIQASRLEKTPAGVSVAKDLAAVYAELATAIATTNNISLTSQAEWVKATRAAVAAIAKLPPLDDQLNALLAGGPGPSPSGGSPASPSTAPSASAVPSATPAPTVAPSTPPPSLPPSVPPSAPASVPPTIAPTPPPGPNAVVNPSFEDGVGPPWALVLTNGAQAIPSVDTSDPYAGKQSARIDITDPTLVRAWISLRQGGLTIEAGAYYQVSVALRASAPRDALVRIMSSTGQSLGNGSNLATIGTDWTVVRFQMTSIMPSDDALIAVDLGGNPDTVWVDNVSVARINPGTP